LLKELESPEDYIRCDAAEALGEFGNRAKIAIPALNNHLQDSDEGLRRAVREALDKIKSAQ